MSTVDQLRELFSDYPWWVYNGAVILVTIVLSWLAFLFTKRIIIRLLQRLARKSKTDIDDILLEEIIAQRLAYIAPILVVYEMARLIPEIQAVVQPVMGALIVLVIVLSIGAFVTQATHYLQRFPAFRDKPLKGYGQVAKLILYIMAAIFIFGLLTGSSPLTLLSGLGAMTAVLILVFRDTILSFVASIHITTNDLVRVGDWIEMRKYGADGDVIDVALHTVKIQNWDKTITVIPTHKLIDDTFKNWRGMRLSGGRRIKRAIHIDISTIRFCTPAMVEKFRKIRLLSEYVARKEKELAEHNAKYDIDDSVLVNGRRMTNIGTFRAYVEAYLRNHDRITHELTFLIRQLAPGETGLPLEIYVFANTTAWAAYEAIQADIFDHLLAVVPEFELRVFQNPSGHDFQESLGRP